MPINATSLRAFSTSSAAAIRATSATAAASNTQGSGNVPVTAHGKQRTMDPLGKLANAAKQCETLGHEYAQCVFAAQFGTDSPQGVELNICRKEFIAFKNCVQEKTGKKW